MTRQGGILLSAFEPSGDALAAPLIAELRRRRRDLPIFALGGPKMQAAGATLIEQTTEHAVMLAAAAGKALEHRKRIQRLRKWMADQRLDVVIPTDSPAANWAVCKAARALQPEARVLHLAAPQLWAWAAWRIHKMRRLSDGVMCLLPFEKAWFEGRGVRASFVGHPIFDRDRRESAAEQRAGVDWPEAPTKLALLPGSRRGEWHKNWAMLVQALGRLKEMHPDLAWRVAAISEDAADTLRGAMHAEAAGRTLMESAPDDPFVIGRADAVIDWADVVLTVSGTVTLQVAAHAKPMVIVYNVSPLAWHAAGRWLVSTRTFTLPNLIGESLGMGRRVPELVPHFGTVEPVVDAVAPLLQEGQARKAQQELFEAIGRCYEGVVFARRAADFVEQCLR